MGWCRDRKVHNYMDCYIGPLIPHLALAMMPHGLLVAMIGYLLFSELILLLGAVNNKNVVLYSSVEVEYRAMAYTTSEMLWAHSLFQDFGHCSYSYANILR